jgi:hypothetical protein
MHQDDDQSVQQKPYDPNDPATHVATPDPNASPNYVVNNPGMITARNGWVNYVPTGIYQGNITIPSGYGIHGYDDDIEDDEDDYELDDGVVRCCGNEAKWVNNGIGFRYWYCSTCKDEVDHPDNDPKKP